MSAGELIAWYLANGYTMQVIRAMFPDFFEEPAAAPVPEWNTLDWLNLWHEEPLHHDPAAHEAAAPGQHLYPHL